MGWVGHPKTMMPMCGHRRMTRRARSSPLERVDIHLVQMNALTRHRIDMNARGVCS